MLSNIFYFKELSYPIIKKEINQEFKILREANLLSSLINAYKFKYENNNRSNRYYEINNVYDASPNKKFKKPSISEKKALENLVSKLSGIKQNLKPEEIQTIVYATGKENGYEKNLRDWFKLIYEVVFGEENGPRMGYFVSFFGLKETIELMKDKISNN